MGKVRIPAQCAEAFPGNHALSRINLNNGRIITPVLENTPVFPQNFCDHSQKNPKLFLVPSNHKPRAKIVQETDKKLVKAYAKPKLSLKTLQFHDASGHKVKSQRREAAVTLLQVMNYYQDDSTGRIGRSVANGTFGDYSLKMLASKAGLQIRRAKRAMKDIVRAGYLKVIKQWFKDPETGVIKGLPSIRSFLPKFFIDLDVKGGIWEKWFTQRGWAKAREDKKLSKEDRKRSRAMMGLIKDSLGGMATNAKKGVKRIMGIVKGVPPVLSKKQTEAHAAHEKMLISKTLELFNLYPDRSISEYYKALKEAHPFV